MNRIFHLVRRCLNLLYYVFSYYKRNSVRVMSNQDTVMDIVSANKSISRYGDGEFDLILNYLRYSDCKCGFQTYSAKLAERLIEILKAEPLKNHLIGLPGVIGSGGVMGLRWEDSRYWQNYLRKHLGQLHNIISLNRLYGDANFTRFYLPYRDKRKIHDYVDKLKKIWEGRDILIIEGVMTRLGVNNDLFDGSKSINRILAPSKDAFGKYDEIYKTALSYLKEHDSDVLVLASLGPTATVLTYDLAKAGYQAIDTGHVDLEYEWMLRGVKEKVKVDGKFVNEVSGRDRDVDITDIAYRQSIIARIE